ncbi:MAG: ferrous iron transport protein B [Firmicutes bacterium]|nr:ferrous iron transport protein B [Bacillota bacterium]
MTGGIGTRDIRIGTRPDSVTKSGRGGRWRWRHRHGAFSQQGDGSRKAYRIALVGSPNVGKSMIFNHLTGLYATVSNYPGTTVEVSRGHARIDGYMIEVIDTPGAYSFVPITDEERVTRDVLISGGLDLVLHVVDARNISRMLNFTFQLIEAGLPVMLVINMMDEAERAGLNLDMDELQRRLGIPVVGTASITGAGIDRLRNVIAAQLGYVERADSRAQGGAMAHANPESRPGDGARIVTYTREIERMLEELTSRLQAAYPVSRRMMGLLAIQQDPWAISMIRKLEPQGADLGNLAGNLASSYQERSGQLVGYSITLRRQAEVNRILRGIISGSRVRRDRLAAYLSRITINPITGVPFLIIVMYLVFYKFVGQFGAGTLVDFIEDRVFGHVINPWVEDFVHAYIPFESMRLLIAGDYGVVTLGLRYAIAIVLPIVGTFFLAFSIIEDSGYLPRLAMLSDRVLKMVGLSGRAIVPLTLGLGCDTMATIVTRTLETERERIIATFLMALAIPCSAQLGVIMGLLAHHPGALLVWLVFTISAFGLSGWLLSRMLPGSAPEFYMELPPLRIPHMGNILKKTFARMKWYFFEVIPIFVLASVLIWAGKLTGVFDMAIHALEPLMRGIGLPPQAATAFLFGFFRRDYGAAGLFDLDQGGLLTPRQLVVAAITLTLFIPCVAQFSIMIKERGFKVAMAISAAVFALAFICGFLVNNILIFLGVTFT